MRHLAIVLTKMQNKKPIGFVPVLCVEEPGKKPKILFLGQGLIRYTNPRKRITCGNRDDASDIAANFANGYNDMTGSHKVKFVNSLQKVPKQVKEFLLEEAKKL